MKKQSNPHNPPIKGYLPLRITLPPPVLGSKNTNNKNNNPSSSPSFTTFLYIKEHNIKKSGNDDGSTIFIANAPANGPIRTDVFLKAIFGQYGDISKVVVAQDPRKVGASLSEDGSESVEIFREAALSALGNNNNINVNNNNTTRGDGKFAHVIFTSGKEMKRAMKAIKREISEACGKKGELFSIQLDDSIIENLKHETKQLFQNEANDCYGTTNLQDEKNDDEEEGNNANNKEHGDSLTGIQAIAAQYRHKAHRHIPRTHLLQLCNSAMAAFEDEEAETERRAKLAAEQPDDDGFITVTHGTAPSFGAANDFEEDAIAYGGGGGGGGDGGGAHRKKSKRNRKRKAGSGAAELTDFYRFQLKETRKKEVHDLRQRFEEDLKKVKKMKEEKAYRPF